MSRDYAYQFLQGDLDLVRYHDPPISATEQQLRLLNGTLSKYLIGFTWHLDGFRVDQLNDQWDWGADWNYNQQNNHAPSDALLQASRVPSALLLAAGVLVIFVLGRALGGRPAAYLASLYYALNPALLIDGRRAIMEGSLTFFSLLVVFASVWLLRKRRWWTAILLGAAAGLALASKHTAVFTVAAVFGACALYPVVEWVIGKWRASKQGRAQHVSIFDGAPLQNDDSRKGQGNLRLRGALRTYAMLVVAGVIALGVFYALNPAWWGDPVTRAGQVLALRRNLLAGQTATFGGYANFPDALGGFFRQMFVNLPQYYEIPAWAGYIAEPIARYESSPWHGVSLGGSVIGGVVLLALTLIGMWATLSDRKLPVSARIVICLWAVAMLITTALLTPLEWQRYYLPAYPAVGLLAAKGIAGLIRRYRPATALDS